MLAFVDESGNAGSKAPNRSSRYFVLAVVAFQDSDDAQACDDAIQLLRLRLSLPARYEFHYAENSKRVKEAFLRTVSPHQFDCHLFAIEKSAGEPLSPEIARSRDMYLFASRRAFEIAKPHISKGTSVTIDRVGNRHFRSELATYLRRHVTDDKGSPLIGRVNMRRSEGNNLLQLVDYVAGIANRSLRGLPQEVEFRRRYLLSHELTSSVWP